MSVTEYGTPMLDGCKCGSMVGLEKVEATELGLEVTLPEFEYLRKVIILHLNGVVTSNSTVAHLHSVQQVAAKASAREGYSMAKVACTFWKGKYYFNVEGNPISFLTGQNMLGVSSLEKMIRLFYEAIELAIRAKHKKFVFPESITTAIENLDIHIHRLAFACYTPELGLKDWRNMKRFFDVLDHIYTGYAGLQKKSVKEYLGIEVSRHGEYSMLFVKRDNNVRQWSLTMYNKAIEIEETSGTTAPDWTANRIRLDLTLQSNWFDRNRCKTLAQLKKRFLLEEYHNWVYELIQRCLEETKAKYLLGFKTLDINPGRYVKAFEAWSSHADIEVTPLMHSWFLEQGLDITIPLNVHMAASSARANFKLADGANDKAILGDKTAMKRLKDKYEDGLSNGAFLPIAKRAHLIQPDINFGRFTKQETKKGLVWVDTSTGEVLS